MQLSQSLSDVVPLRRWWRELLVASAVLVATAAYNQPYWPATWLDEGFVTNGAMTLATRQVYGTSSADGVRVVHPTLVANGPGVLVPIAAAMRLGGTDIRTARRTAGLFMVLCGLLVVWVAARLSNPLGGLAALVLLLAMPREGFVYLGRMAMGNVPALAYVFLGLGLWRQALERSSARRALAVGALFGLAAVTKAQWSVVLLPTLVLAALIHRFVLQRRDGRLFAMVALGLCGALVEWYGARLWLQGAAAFTVDLAELRETAQWNVLAFDPVRYAPLSAWYLVRTGIVLVWLPALAFTAWLAIGRRPGAPAAVLPGSIAAMWMAWYVVASVGWPRYAFEGFAVSAVLAGAAVGRWREVWQWLDDRRPRQTALGAAMGFAAVLAVVVGVHGANRVRDLAAPPDRSAQSFAAALAATVDRRELIESWEWQLDVLVDRSFHHPDDIWVGRYTAQIFGGVPVRESYRWQDHLPGYLIDGPFSKFTGMYRGDLAADCCTLVTSDGTYDLYRVRRRAEADPFSQ